MAEKREGNPLSSYLKGAWSELRKVTWPSRKETWTKSWIVIWFSLAFAVCLGGIDYILNEVVTRLV
ncbi:MAG: preprotein translocase subunit SecE [Candidatus Kerfeldbacteria bacterium CG15_BIG_FIL_POST_REV_8_21_14_020_45_12]|uniref:Protein translocase subunit SecE n=1 Tax=Candidatus Kerfeldbacteria bacterium CG15_BIG_FIL_POST_REV_8_21_14_020_45_12 TaxID=2014247 RepID=A0A2M7H4L6_9BACT|nr:MAG: preprotein translocase subunit SecE [Candidatus Kerfeldbacteria bacterium CG15_BIG_FIL_POST_REV_8_21_14_020_45_12]PJA93927.1 MAG: preprotein translocase subunit SecE [Candidatus Kerfeldbacteria bacterium CG_4_9_14_3_um_filter_45_8]